MVGRLVARFGLVCLLAIGCESLVDLEESGGATDGESGDAGDDEEQTPQADCQEDIAGGAVGAERPTVHNGEVYWASLDGVIFSQTFAAETDTRIVLATYQHPTWYALEGERVLSADAVNVNLRTVGVADTEFLAVQSHPRSPVWSGPNRAYWIDRPPGEQAQSLVRWDAQTLAVETVVSGWGEVEDMVAVENAIYALVGQFPNPDGTVDGRLARFDEVTGQARAIAPLDDAVGLVFSDNRLAWVERGGSGADTIRSVNADGSAPQVLATIEDGVGTAVALDGNDLYYSAADVDESRVFRLDEDGAPELVFETPGRVLLGLALSPEHVYITLAPADDYNLVLTRVCR